MGGGGGRGVDGKLVSYVATLELSRVCFMLCDVALQFILQITQTHIFTWAHTHTCTYTRAHTRGCTLAHSHNKPHRSAGNIVM